VCPPAPGLQQRRVYIGHARYRMQPKRAPNRVLRGVPEPKAGGMEGMLCNKTRRQLPLLTRLVARHAAGAFVPGDASFSTVIC
jgi:hypothetical protein